MNKSLSNLFKSLSQEFSISDGYFDPISRDHQNQAVKGITSDSRQVRAGSVFVAVQGGAQDGHSYIEKAIQDGAIFIVGEKKEKDLGFKLSIPYLQVADSRKALAFLAAWFFDNPTQNLLVVGVTGTSGKTTTTYLIESILQAAGYQVGVIGTVNFRFGSKIFPSTHTTPGAVELQQLLQRMKKEGCTAVVMEVSSHALKQHRVGYIAFDGVVFTNLSPEHLDFHPDMEDYFQSKAMLFREYLDYSITQNKSPVAVLNEADSYGQRLLQENSQKKGKFFEFARLSNVQLSLNGIQGRFNDLEIHSQLTGQFNVSNIAAAVALTQALKLSSISIQNGINHLKGIPGRLERVANSCGIHIWVDYAHKPDALEKVVKTLQEIKNRNRLITVFGCGGDRDRKKRPQMGRIAVEGSDWVWVTSDNPRTEDPIAIIQEILVGTQGFKNYQVEPDRRKAIFQAIQNAQPGDLVLIAGKGHEDYQILGTSKIHFDDREEAIEACRSRLESR